MFFHKIFLRLFYFAEFDVIDRSIAQQVLNEILLSPEFKDSKRFQELLTYLVEETLSGNVPKEITIGMQFFSKDSSFDPKEDPTVRVYLNNLRKKLDHYYLTTESTAEYRLEIPKGHYQVEFSKSAVKENFAKTNRKQNTVIVALTALLFILVAFIITDRAFPSLFSDAPLEDNPIWHEFVAPGGKPTLVVLGDFYFLFERGTEGRMGNFVRDLRFNTPDDYRQFIRTNPKFSEKYVQSEFTFLRPSASWGLAEILPVLEQSPNGYSLKLASEFTVEDLKANNIVFIGSFKSLFAVQKFLHIFDIEYQLSPNEFHVKNMVNDSMKVYRPGEMKGGKYEKDYAVLSKGVGPNGSNIMLMLGFADTGVLEAARASVDAAMLTKIETELVRKEIINPFYFTMVVKSEGISQAIFNADISHFELRTINAQGSDNMDSADSH
jgi:hypothetical protein